MTLMILSKSRTCIGFVIFWIFSSFDAKLWFDTHTIWNRKLGALEKVNQIQSEVTGSLERWEMTFGIPILGEKKTNQWKRESRYRFQVENNLSKCQTSKVCSSPSTEGEGNAVGCHDAAFSVVDVLVLWKSLQLLRSRFPKKKTYSSQARIIAEFKKNIINGVKKRPRKVSWKQANGKIRTSIS